MACGILAPWPGMDPGPLAGKVWSPNHWTAREFLVWIYLDEAKRRKHCVSRVNILWENTDREGAQEGFGGAGLVLFCDLGVETAGLLTRIHPFLLLELWHPCWGCGDMWQDENISWPALELGLFTWHTFGQCSVSEGWWDFQEIFQVGRLCGSMGLTPPKCTEVMAPSALCPFSGHLLDSPACCLFGGLIHSFSR